VEEAGPAHVPVIAEGLRVEGEGPEEEAGPAHVPVVAEDLRVEGEGPEEEVGPAHVPVVAEDLRVEGERPEKEVGPAHAQGEIAQPFHPQHPAPGFTLLHIHLSPDKIQNWLNDLEKRG